MYQAYKKHYNQMAPLNHPISSTSIHCFFPFTRNAMNNTYPLLQKGLSHHHWLCTFNWDYYVVSENLGLGCTSFEGIDDYWRWNVQQNDLVVVNCLLFYFCVLLFFFLINVIEHGTFATCSKLQIPLYISQSYSTNL
jgi:hypothetical protein